ncbi:MAG: CRISPR system precrRNA processing endoribonuclease RAMP protein Cas6 [Candidatus Eremiobacterota bacterium]
MKLDLDVLPLRFELEALDRVGLPAFSGSTFRGVMGRALKRVGCATGRLCEACEQPERCAYHYLFESQAPPDTGVNQGSAEVPRPFVLEPPTGTRELAPGEAFGLGLNLLGRGIGYLPFFVHCVLEMGRHGLGQRAARFRVKRVLACGPDRAARTFFEGDRVLSEPEPWNLQALCETTPARRVEVRFLTPARLTHQGELVGHPDFHVVVRALLRRLDLLSRVHGPGPVEADFPALVARAGEVRVAQQSFRWFDWERQSFRQNRSMRLGGVVGHAVYEGPLDEFVPLLQAGSVLHLGKATTFGLGKIAVGFQGLPEGPIRSPAPPAADR